MTNNRIHFSSIEAKTPAQHRREANEQIAYQAGLIAASYPIESPPYVDKALQAAYEKGKADRAKIKPR